MNTRLGRVGRRLAAALCVMLATMYGWLIVWPWPIGSAPSAYADPRMSTGTNFSRGTARIARSTSASLMPLRSS